MNIRHSIMIAFVCMLLTGLSESSALYAKALGARSSTITLVVKSSPDAAYVSRKQIKSSRLLRELRDPEHRRKTDVDPVTDSYVAVRRKSHTSRFAVDGQGNVFDMEKGMRVVLSPKAKKDLMNGMIRLRKKHYGKFLSWEQAGRYVPRKSVFKVVDLETGLSFHVQRRAGSSHADVQPLTKADTQTMKAVYNGKWSWKRRAILVQTKNKSIAASMHGMPHGGDGIPDNGFSGHFCIHFKGSATHRSKTVDPSHQLMIYKAAGQWNEYFAQAGSKEIVEAFLASLKQQDAQMLRNAVDNKKTNRELVNFHIRDLQRITAFHIRNDIQIVKSGSMENELIASVKLAKKDERPENRTYTFIVRRASGKSPWKIAQITLITNAV